MGSSISIKGAPAPGPRPDGGGAEAPEFLLTCAYGAFRPVQSSRLRALSNRLGQGTLRLEFGPVVRFLSDREIADRGRPPLEAESFESARAQLVEERPPRPLGVERPVVE